MVCAVLFHSEHIRYTLDSEVTILQMKIGAQLLYHRHIMDVLYRISYICWWFTFRYVL